jgi:uncharacterized repeat protein (TIGR03943 family)
MTTSAVPSVRRLNWAALIESVLLGGTAAMLLAKVWSGTLVYYIHTRYTPLIVVCAVMLAAVAAARLHAFVTGLAEPLHLMRWRYLLAALPLLLGALVPARPLGSDALSGATLNLSVATGADVLGDDTGQWNLLEWVTALSVRGDELQGHAADVIGFVYHDPARSLDGFFVVRYVVTCCTADSNGAGLPVIWPGGAALLPDGWVRVRGKLGTTTLAGQVAPALIATSVENVPRPVNPYLYP